MAAEHDSKAHARLVSLFRRILAVGTPPGPWDAGAGSRSESYGLEVMTLSLGASSPGWPSLGFGERVVTRQEHALGNIERRCLALDSNAQLVAVSLA